MSSSECVLSSSRRDRWSQVSTTISSPGRRSLAPSATCSSKRTHARGAPSRWLGASSRTLQGRLHPPDRHQAVARLHTNSLLAGRWHGPWGCPDRSICTRPCWVADSRSRADQRIGFQGAETLLTECDLGEAAGRFIDGSQSNRIPADLIRVAAAARACTPDR
jgi:hypothetical protein